MGFLLPFSAILPTSLLFLLSLPPHLATEFKCPTEWREFGSNCYRFTRSPVKTADEASQICGQFNAHLLSVLSVEEHKFITDWLRGHDPVHLSWYTSALDTGNNAWRWNVPIHALSTTGATSSIASSLDRPGTGGTGLDAASSFSGHRGGREFFSILATLWLPKEEQQRSVNDPFRQQQQQPFGQSIIDTTGGNLNNQRFSRHAAYK